MNTEAIAPVSATSDQSEAQRYLVLADAYCAAAQRLRDDKVQATSAPFYLLASHAIELSLKAILLGQGVGAEALMIIGHNLEACLRSAVRRGFPAQSIRTSRTLARLGAAHGAQAFRYPQALNWTPPDPEETLAVATRMLRKAREHMG